MQKKAIFILIGLVVGIISISGCIENTKANSTWGEKKISMDAIKVSNDTVGNRSEYNDSIYYVSGYILNQNPYEALDPKITVTTYYSNGTVFAVNDTPHLNPQNIPAKGKSSFFARFEDPDIKIAKFEVKILSAKGEY
jgi:ABC-type dipeptide/oligopeptide/nickel transport system ATPase subunit